MVLHAEHPSTSRLERVNRYWRAANYLGAIQLYLQHNALLREPLAAQHIKPRLLGHWGTVPGLNLIYAHLNRLILDTGARVVLVVGPGHGAPAIYANLFLEGSLAQFYPQFERNGNGIARLARSFSWPGGLPSHISPLTPGALHEGGELGYSVGHAFGVAFDNPDTIVACVVGDGEAETGALAAGWQSNKFLDPSTSGAVLPILHLNGYKLSGPSIFARMSGLELHQYFVGCGYDMRLVATTDPAEAHRQLWSAMNWAYERIATLQRDHRERRASAPPTWPLIVLRTPKGWTGPRQVDGRPVEGTFHAHQLPISDPRNNSAHLQALDDWLRSYRPEELFDERGAPAADLLATLPPDAARMGMSETANGGAPDAPPLRLPRIAAHAIQGEQRGAIDAAATQVLGGYLRDTFRLNGEARNFRLTCPDETMSNKLEAVFEATDRAFMWPLVETDEFLAQDGRVLEILSETTCEGWLEGYTLSGRHGMFACYEAFATIVDSMAAQHAKWLKASADVAWRRAVPSLNILLTSHAWRQDHNGYSHQGPGFIDTIASKKATVVRVYLPPDANCVLEVADRCLRSKCRVNLIIAAKHEAPLWLSPQEAAEHCERGASYWKWASNDDGATDVVLAAAGDVPTLETMAAAALLRTYAPDMRVRVVNVVDLFSLPTQPEHPHGLSAAAFDTLFGTSEPVIFAFHGYPRLIHELIHRRQQPQRFHVHGYIEEGTTTTPFDMVVRNKMSRYHLALDALARAPGARGRYAAAQQYCEERLAAHSAYIVEHGVDLPEVADWRWPDAHATR
ncbi:MAG: phosphoketolase family protein [Candidatus Eremiobacteraeota bacterium]|nr:phosphoketolase family protein [Candidatus Eremiobacteraeota bacterium]MBV8366046.1 phosphoketolase family protein [Candidatus Eremiobacteraeota bacterium]